MNKPNMPKPSTTSLPSLRVRIDLDTEDRIGPGKIQLLENIRSCGSISAAGRAMNMSYKRAWDLVDEINRICKRSVVKRWEGGKGGGVAYARAVRHVIGGALSEDQALGGKCCPRGVACVAG